MEDENILKKETEPKEQCPLHDKSCELSQSSFESFSKDLERSFQTGQEIAEILRPAIENFSDIIRGFSSIISAIRPELENIRNALTTFAEAIINIQTPNISEERKEELISNYKRWGEYGWTFFPDAPLSCFEEFPASIEMANAEMKPFCNAEEMSTVFEELREQNIKKEDLESAIFCYQHYQYKACALIVCGIIDAKMIRKQKTDGKNRCVGKRAVQKLWVQYEHENSEKLIFSLLFGVNLFSCLETIFSNGNDFKKEPPVINRNFISHGMNRRAVRKRDCIQLFLVLNNLTHVLSYISTKRLPV